ncbi:MAG: SDR family NAD(P)-dependent oxidoreductase, partial [Myxococcota bacterium]
SVVAAHERADGLLGLCATLALEQPGRWGRLVLVDDATPEAEVQAELAASGDDDVVSLAGGERRVPRLGGVFGRTLEPPPLDPQRAVVVTGGTGAFGRAIAGWLADLGARHLVLVSRSGGAPMPELEARGVRVDRVAADVADEGALHAALAGLELGGVIHAAGIADPTPLSAVDPAGFDAVWRVKVGGIEALDRQVRGSAPFFVAVSSIAAVWGAPDLGAYGAANRAMHAVIRARRARGERGVALAFGPLALGGMVDAADRARFAAAGVAPVSTAEALRQLGAALHPDAPAEWVAARVDWAKLGRSLSLGRRRPLLDGFVTEAPPAVAAQGWLDHVAAVPVDVRHRAVVDALALELAAVLGRDRSTALDPHRPLFDLGLDSAMAVELAQRLRALTGRSVPATIAFDHPSLDRLARAVLDLLGLADRAGPAPAAHADTDEPVAIVGFSCRFPGADDPDAFWDLLVRGGDAVGPVPAGRWTADPAVVAEAAAACGGAGGYLAGDLAGFEPNFWGMSAAEASALDPQHRLVLELGWESLERAGIAPDSLEGSRTGVWVGVSRSEYWDGLRAPNDPALEDVYPWSGIGNASSFVAGRLAHTLGVRGPAMSIDTACSSSLVAVHLACRALRDGEVGLALAGGVNVLLSAESTVYLGRIGALSRTGRCRSFDAAADGYTRGEGCGFVVLKRLSDAVRDGDRVWATIRGSAVGHDGRSGGLTVPSPAAQREVIERALDAAGVTPSDVAVLEAHGTGTPLGDPIEIGAVRAVLGAGRARPLVVSTVKTNLGHLESAAGIAGLLKVVLSMHHGQVPGNVHLTRPNPALPLDFPVQLPTAVVPWPSGPRIAGVSSFGISGTTAHVVLEGAPATPVVEEPPGLALWTVSADSEPALDALVAGLARAHAPIGQLASTLARGRAARRLRIAAVGDTRDALLAGLAEAERIEARPRPRIGFLFTGQGAQAPAMAARLYREDPAFARALDELLAPVPELRPILLEPDERVHDTTWTQPALVALGLALAARLAEAGITPECALGHSIGELSAAAVAGVFAPADALLLAVERGARMGALPAGGGMLAARASESAVRAVVPDVEIAGINAPDETVLAGPLAALDAARAALAAAGIDARPLAVSHAFHSAAMEPMLDGFGEVARAIPHAPPRIHLVTNLDGSALSAVDPSHWVRHVRAPVRFADGLRTAAARVDLWLELGPRPTLSGLGARVVPGAVFLPSLAPGRDGAAAVLALLGACWAHGAAPLPDALAPRRAPAEAPTTPWQRTRHWVGAAPPARALAPQRVTWVTPPERTAARAAPPLDRLDPALAVDLAVLLLDPVAGDAGHALARNLAARPKRRFTSLAELGSNLLVAA